MTKYVSRVKLRLNCFQNWKLEHVPRDSNEKANALASVVASLPITETIFLPIYYQSDFSIASPQVNQVDKDPPVLDGPHPAVSKHKTTSNGEE